MRLDCRPDLTLTMTAVLTPNAAHATSVASPVAMVVIPWTILPLRRAAIGAKIKTKPAKPQARGLRMRALVVL